MLTKAQTVSSIRDMEEIKQICSKYGFCSYCVFRITLQNV